MSWGWIRLGIDDDSPTTTDDLGNKTLSIPVPEGTDSGEYILTAAISYLVGVSPHPPIRAGLIQLVDGNGDGHGNGTDSLGVRIDWH